MPASMKTPLALVANWWRSSVDSEVILKEYRSFRDLESSIQGLPSTPSTDNITDIYESIAGLNPLSLHYDSIITSLEELSRYGSSQFKIPNEIEWHSIMPENAKEMFKQANDMEVNIGFLWAAFLKRSDLLPVFLELGAELSFYEHNYGLSALHLTAYSGCKSGTEYLLSQTGCYVNLMCKCYSPLHCAAFGNYPEIASILLEKGANIDAITNDLHSNLEGVLHCAVRSNAVDCLKLFCNKGVNINQLDSYSRTPIHLAAELGYSECLRVLAEAKGANIDYQTKEKQQTALHIAAYRRHGDCVDILLDHGAGPNIVDYKHRTPLHLAAKSPSNDCVKLLLRKGKTNPNLQDANQRTPLHLSVAEPHQINSCDTIRTLLRYGADINAKDYKRCTPLHLAATNELSQDVETLILHNADITAKCEAGITALGMIYRKTPACMDALRKKLDECIFFKSRDYNCRESDLEINFTPILQHCHPKEIEFLNTLLAEGQKELLLHPVCRAFLHLKWRKIRKFFIFRAICCFLLVVSMSSYVLMGLAKHCYNVSKNITLTTYELDKDLCLNHSFSGSFVLKYPFIIELEWYLMVIFALAIVGRKLCAMSGYSSFNKYIFSLQNFLDWSTVTVVFLISYVYTGRTYIWQNHVCAFGVLIAWCNFFYLLGQFPFFGTYIAMYSSVQKEFAKLLLVFSCLHMGFNVSFCVLFPNSAVFSNVYIGFITVLVMAIGEANLDLITQPSKEDQIFMLRGSAELIYAIFIACVTIILLNLLVGIAVHDIQGLKKTAKVAKLTKATELIACMDKALFTDYFHRKVLSEICRWSTLISTNGYYSVTVKIYNHQQGILPSDIIQSAFEVARKHKKRNKANKSYEQNKSSLINPREQLKKDFSSRNLAKEVNISGLQRDVRNLSNQVMNMKEMLEANQRLMEQVLRSVNAGDEGMNF